MIDKDMIERLAKPLPRTERFAQAEFDNFYNRKEPEYQKRCYLLAKKMKAKGWTDNHFYQTVIKPWLKKYESKERCSCCGREIVEDINSHD
jgi:hypothetical protein